MPSHRKAPTGCSGEFELLPVGAENGGLNFLSRAPASIFHPVDVVDDPLPAFDQLIDLLDALGGGEPFFPCEIVDFHLDYYFVHTNNIGRSGPKVKLYFAPFSPALK